MAEKLRKDLHLLSGKRDMNLESETLDNKKKKKGNEFVNDLLVPLLRAEECVPVCIHPFDSDYKSWISVPQHHRHKLMKRFSESLFLSTSMLHIKQKGAFMKTFKTIVSRTKNARKLINA